MVKKLNTTTAQSSSEQDSTDLKLQTKLDLLRQMEGRGNVKLPHGSYINLGMNRIGLSRILYYTELYKKILDVPGCICEFGVRFGDTLSLFSNLRGIFEPYNYTRKLHGFDTFEGFPSLDPKDSDVHELGECTVPQGYEKELDEILSLHEEMSPISHMKKHEIHKGDATKTFPSWLEKNPQTCIAMAILDMDLYEPTKVVLQNILPHMPKGAILVFDEFSYPHFPGEAIAVKEILQIHSLKLHMNPHQPSCAWAVIGET